MLILSANTYPRGYGATIVAFGVYNTREECIARMKEYNEVDVPKLRADFEKFKENEYSERGWGLYKSLSKFGIDVYSDEFTAFEFNLNRPEDYIFDLDGTPVNLGGYVE